MPSEDIRIIITGDDKGASGTISDVITQLEALSAALDKVEGKQGAVGGLSIPKTPTLDTSSVDQTLSGMVEIKDAAQGAGEAFAETREILTQVGQAATDANSEVALSAKKGAKTMEREYSKSSNKVVAAFKRILFYRFVRSAIREVGQAFKEGLDSYYAYDQKRGGKFASSMDQLASELTYVKQSLGAALAPLIVSLTPVLLNIGDLLVTLIDAFNQFFSAIESFINQGDYTWEKLEKPTVTYEQLTKANTDATKKLNASLLKFDEINRLNGENESSRSGSSDKNGIDDSGGTRKQIDNLTVWLTGAGLGALITNSILKALQKHKQDNDKNGKSGGSGDDTPKEAFSPNGSVPIVEPTPQTERGRAPQGADVDTGALAKEILPPLVEPVKNAAVAIAKPFSQLDLKSSYEATQDEILELSRQSKIASKKAAYAAEQSEKQRQKTEEMLKSAQRFMNGAGDATLSWEKSAKLVSGVVIGLVTVLAGAFAAFSFGDTSMISQGLSQIASAGAFATGGFPATGTMFIANERGAEMVGQIGQKTAVVNNEQIVSAVAGGVAAANTENNNLLREQNNLLRQILLKEGSVTVSSHDIVSALNRLSSRSGVPVGNII